MCGKELLDQNTSSPSGSAELLPGARSNPARRPSSRRMYTSTALHNTRRRAASSAHPWQRCWASAIQDRFATSGRLRAIGNG